jgi:hypothetical protein
MGKEVQEHGTWMKVRNLKEGDQNDRELCNKRTRNTWKLEREPTPQKRVLLEKLTGSQTFSVSYDCTLPSDEEICEYF